MSLHALCCRCNRPIESKEGVFAMIDGRASLVHLSCPESAQGMVDPLSDETHNQHRRRDPFPNMTPIRKLRLACDLILHAIGEDPAREGLHETRDRFARAWLEFANYDPGNIGTSFSSVQTDQMVIVDGINAWSMCEHHLMPFSVEVAIGYVAKDRVLGLSKFARVVEAHCHRLQIQERLTDDIAKDIGQRVGTFQAGFPDPDVAVLVKGRHLCMCSRGIKKDAVMTTSAMYGVFRTKPEARSEFLSLVNGS